MGIAEGLSLLVAAIIVPYVVALIRSKAVTGKKAMWLAICVSFIAGIVAGLVGGIPTSFGEVVGSIVAAVGGTQIAYATFRSIGITNKWLDALMEVGTKKEEIKVGGNDD